MDRPSNMPRRAWQRRNLRCNRAANSNSSIGQSTQLAGMSPARNRQLSSGQESGYGTDSSVGSTSDSESGPAAPRTTLAARPHRHSDSDSTDDSSYCSLDEDANNKAQYYDDLFERFQVEGPTLANHRDNTKTMEEE